MKKHLILILFTFFLIHLSGQEATVNSQDSYKYFIKKLQRSKDIMYEDVLKQYDAEIRANPDDVMIQVNKCRFIGNAYYDETEGYDQNYEQTENCINDLYERYPDHPEVILYKLEQLYGDEKETFLESSIGNYLNDTERWLDRQVGELYESGAYYYQYKDNSKVISYSIKAEKANDSIDLTLQRANAYLDNGHEDLAEATLRSKLDFDSNPWTLNQKGELFLKLDEGEQALKLFERVAAKDSVYLNNTTLYQVFKNNQEYEKARVYLVKDTVSEWTKTNALNALFNHDLHHSDVQTALSMYRRTQEEGIFNDFFGINRLKLLFKGVVSDWTFGDVLRILFLHLSIVLLFLIPYLWVLPIHYLSTKVLRSRITPLINFDWSLRHFWLICFVFLLIDVLTQLLFNYQGFLNYLFEDLESNLEMDLSVKINFWYVILMFVSTLLFLNRDRIKYLYRTKIGTAEIIALCFAFLIFNFLLISVLNSFGEPSFFPISSIKEIISGLIEKQGLFVTLLMVAVMVPIYEEVIFRGIIFSSLDKSIGFWMANVIQALLFAIIHENSSLFLYYFSFGFIAGLLVRRSNGLMVGIMFHMLTNTMATMALYFSKNMDSFL